MSDETVLDLLCSSMSPWVAMAASSSFVIPDRSEDYQTIYRDREKEGQDSGKLREGQDEGYRHKMEAIDSRLIMQGPQKT